MGEEAGGVTRCACRCFDKCAKEATGFCWANAEVTHVSAEVWDWINSDDDEADVRPDLADLFRWNTVWDD